MRIQCSCVSDSSPSFCAIPGLGGRDHDGRWETPRSRSTIHPRRANRARSIGDHLARLLPLVVLAVLSVGGSPDHAAAQTNAFGVMLGVDGLYDYPRNLRLDCDEGFGVGANIRFTRRLGTSWGADLGIALPFQVRTDRDDALDGGCGPSFPGASVRRSPRGSPSAVGEVRLARTLAEDGDGNAFRVIGGVGWVIGRGTPAVIAGMGHQWPRVSVDLEHWRVGTPFDVFENPAPGERILVDSGRDWEGVWLVRVGFVLWPHEER